MPRPITIGVDIRDLRVAKTGTLTYLEEVCKAFKNLQSDKIRFKFLDTNIPIFKGKGKFLNLLEHARYQVWKQLVLPLKAFLSGCDIVFCTDNVVPLIHLGFKTIPVFHDAFFFETPESYGRLWLWLYNKTAIPAARRSPFVVTPTEYAKKQINHFTKISVENLVVVYEGPKSLPDTDQNADALLSNLSIHSRDYILHVGSMYRRKNIPALIYAFAKLKGDGYAHLKLVLAGPTPANAQQSGFDLVTKAIEETGLRDEIILTGYMTDEQLSVLYKNALMYVFPSINEGFGIPILEAFKNGLPVLVANNTCLPEVGGDAVVQFDPFNNEDIYQKIKSVADDTALRYELISKGYERSKSFSWQNTALSLAEVFKRAVKH